MLLRVAFGVGLLALGYFVGREMGRNESLRKELERERELNDSGPDGPAEPDVPETGDSARTLSAETRESPGV